MRPLLHVEHLVKQYPKNGQPALVDVSFSVTAGESFALYGRSGAGKSTLLAILAALLPKSYGRVTIAGCDLDQQAPAIRQEVGVVGPAMPLDLTLTAEENLRLHVCRHELYVYHDHYQQMPAHYRQRIAILATELACDLFQPVACFSPLMQRKLAITRSLLHDPLLVLLDEPTAGLDPQSRRFFWRYVHALRRRKGFTLVLATANLAETGEADRVGLLQHGELLFEAKSQLMRSLAKSILYDEEHLYEVANKRKPAHTRCPAGVPVFSG